MEIDKKRYLRLSLNDRKDEIRGRITTLLGWIDWYTRGESLIDKEPPTPVEIRKEWESIKESVELQIKEALELTAIRDGLHSGDTARKDRQEALSHGSREP